MIKMTKADNKITKTWPCFKKKAFIFIFSVISTKVINIIINTKITGQFRQYISMSNVLS